MTEYYCTAFGSRFGEAGLVWTRRSGPPNVVRVILPDPVLSVSKAVSRLFPTTRPASCAAIDRLGRRIVRFLSGRPIDFDLDRIDTTQLYEFQKQVIMLERCIPRGRISTYGQLARKLGRPHAARAVGHALAHNPFPIIIPCHRVVMSDGSLGGYRGGPKLKRALLEFEGIRFDASGKVSVARPW